ncbi:hypothetical protein MtrunA17_Chr2g0307491 [Medicago truncatula]|uniref:Uncharacterized protein n=1 Tax=Medicago truncatula TaxID=3880 RepID=A0A396JCR7_MEDTR|nr:hypothetical protein MtrunA17_Chr2g0307491 [Medicago truncatula]
MFSSFGRMLDLVTTLFPTSPAAATFFPLFCERSRIILSFCFICKL